MGVNTPMSKTPLSNYRLRKAEKDLLKSLGYGSETRGIRAALELIRLHFGVNQAKKIIRTENLGILEGK